MHQTKGGSRLPLAIWVGVTGCAFAEAVVPRLAFAQDTVPGPAPQSAAMDTLLVRVVETGTEWDFVIAVVALLAAVGGTIFAGVQARLARRTLEASVTPAVTCTADMAGNNSHGPGFRLHNAGPGAARITRFVIRVDGTPVTGTVKGGWSDALAQVGLKEADFRKSWYSPGGYVAPGETDALLAYRGANWATEEVQIRAALRRLTIEVGYEDSLQRAGQCALVAKEHVAEPKAGAVAVPRQ